MALCHTCISVLKDDDAQNTHNTCRSFLEALDEGCYICQRLFSRIREEWKQGIRGLVETSEPSVNRRRKLDDSETWLTRCDNNPVNTRHGPIWLYLRGWDAEASLHRADILGRLGQRVSPVAAESVPGTLTSSPVTFEEKFTKLKTWLGRCGEAHNKCRLRTNEADVGWHPTRLIEIALSPELSDNANHLKCRLVEPQSGDMPQNLRYITLSHRWPQDQEGFQKLTEDKLPLWKASLPLETLRQTFRDAFWVAHKFGIPYVWIDSLCIIQDGDDYADWRRESPMMQKVYSNAEFNICASKNDEDGGLFSSQVPSGPQNSPVRKEAPEVIWDKRMNDTPLASRGWVFQEQLLSRANLHFGDDEVLFECREMRASESLGSDEDYEESWGRPLPFFKEHLPIPAVMEGGSVSSTETSGSGGGCSVFTRHNFSKHFLWHGLLRQYTKRQLTRSEDRLVALSGVAQYFKASFWNNDFYIAGLWRSRLITEMLWQMTESTPREDWVEQRKRRHNLTFSWASVGGEVRNQADIRSDTCHVKCLADSDVMNYRTSPEASDATRGEGQPFTEDIFSLPAIPTVEIRLTGFLRPISLERAVPATGSDELLAKNEHRQADSDLVLCSARWEGLLEGQTRLDFEISSSELTALNDSGRLFLMPLIAMRCISVWFLLLEHVETNEWKDMGRFRRIGVHEAHGDRFLLRCDTQYMSSTDSFRDLPCWRYDAKSKHHTIFVI